MKVIEMITDDEGFTRRGDGIKAWLGVDEGLPDDWESDNFAPDTRYACCMIPIPDGYRLATEEDFRDGPRVAKTAHSFAPDWDRVNGCYSGDSPELIYAVPIETEASNRRRELEKRLKDAEALVASVRKDIAKEDV